jgi:hypothetical protein
VKSKINLGKLAAFILFIYVLGNFIARWTYYAFSDFPLASFDGALRILPHYYMGEGLIPYKDFGVLYPPGLFLLIGKIIPFASIFQRNLILEILELALLVTSWILLYKIPFKLKRTILPATFVIMLETIMLDEFLFSELFSRTLICVLILMLVHVMKGKKAPFFFAILISSLVVWFRWSSIVLLVITQLITIAGLSLYSYFKKSHIEDGLKRVWKFIAFEVIGVILGLASLFIYLITIGAFHQGIDFIFNIPAQVIFEYRTISLFHFDNGTIILFFVTFIAFAINILSILYRRDKFLLLFLSVIPFFILSYALWRADQFHLFQFYYFVGLSFVVIYSIMSRPKFLSFLMIILFLPAYFYFSPVQPYLQTSKSFLDSNLAQNLQDCKRSVSNLGNYHSLFVGRLSYSSFLMNVASLYLINTQVKPATAFISDEPGLQNSLRYGSIIADQLRKAPKPMLAFLEIGQQSPESNKTQFMKSEGKIELELASNKYKTIGACQAYGHSFMIRLYN